MQQFKAYFITLALLFFNLSTNYSIPATPFPVQVVQPDGSILTLRIYGDEFNKIRTTIDGYLVSRNRAGYYIYADSKGNTEQGRIAKNPELRTNDDKAYLSQHLTPALQDAAITRPSRIRKAPATALSSGFPKIGSPRSLVILVNFTDKSFAVPDPKDAFSRLLNTEGYNENGGTGSARDYFRASSNGQFNPNFDVVGPYTLPNNMAYYGANNSDDFDLRPADMVIHACSLANEFVNFADYDIDNDGYVDNVFIYYAGYNEAEGANENTVWPHRWAVYSGNYTGSKVFDGKTVYDYACTSELKGSSGNNMCGIGTFTHEFGHVIGLPDHYHTDDPNKNTLNYWSIMDMGAYLNEGRTPPAYSAYDRFYLGWIKPEELKTPANHTLFPLSLSTTAPTRSKGQAYLLSATTHNMNGGAPSPAEFFVLEYRKKTGWDRFLPAEGMLIWHINYNQSAWDSNSPNNYTGSSQTASSHMRIYLQPLSGNTTTPGTAFTSGSFIPRIWSGININRPITNIVKTTDSISFDLMGGIQQPVAKIVVGEVNSTLRFSEIQSGEQQTKNLNLKTTALTGDLTLGISGQHAAQFKISASTIPFIETESTSGKAIAVTYSPSTAGIHTAILTISSNGILPERRIELQGQSVE